jgi:hypothetical protein
MRSILLLALLPLSGPLRAQQVAKSNQCDPAISTCDLPGDPECPGEVWCDVGVPRCDYGEWRCIVYPMCQEPAPLCLWGRPDCDDDGDWYCPPLFPDLTAAGNSLNELVP